MKKSPHVEPRETYEAKRKWLQIKKHYDDACKKCIELMLNPHVSNEQLAEAAASLRHMRKAVVDGAEEISTIIKRDHPDT